MESFGSRKDLGLISGENSLSCDLSAADKGLSNLIAGSKRKRDMRQNITCIIARSPGGILRVKVCS